MSIESFFTIQSLVTPQGGKGLAVGNGQALTADSGQGLAFLDFILARLNEASEEGETKATDHNLLQSDNPALEKNPKLDLAEILAANPEIEEELKNFIEATGLGPNTALAQVLELNQQAFDDALKPLTEGIITAEEIAKGSPRILQALLIEQSENGEVFASKINEIKAKIQRLIESGEGEIIATNLTPEELAAIQSLPENITENIPGGFDYETALKEAGVPQELIEKTSVVLIRFVSPQADIVEQSATLSDDPAAQNVLALFIPPAQKINGNATAGEGKTPTDILAARLNALIPGGAEGLNQEARFTIEGYEGNTPNIGKNGKAVNTPAFDALVNTAGGKGPAPAPDLSILQGFPFTAQNAALAPYGFSQTAIDEYGLSPQTNASINMAGLVSTAVQAHSATAAHPAVQMVAVNIQKAASNGENKTLMLQLDPPELGRVQVKMEFGADKTLKAVVMAEKPETFMMLQRDAQTLERALQEAGLDTDGGLSFELAEQGFDFDSDNRRGGGHDKGGTGAGDATDDGELIESTMTWHVDPDTGHTRYDILA